ncbi:unnamed protein product [Rotaria socialis]|uniref:ABC-type xenobiotic transporter n=1 Tax=Rotaria socialis TaxID=392032 RepID=A0A820SQD7_9BILA|nr:unnamed protein product [Rotaria socialis]CAF4457995.1 unnamed protein product [Rotaria socialis]
MELSNFLSLICNDSSDSSSKIWFDQDLSPCFRKYVLEFVLYTITLILVSYNIGQRLKCSYRLWTLPLALIRFGSSLVLITTFSFYFYDYFFANNTKYQWIDAINILLILNTHLFICYFNFNRNLYHNKRPMNYIIWMIIFFVIQNYDIYRIVIKHLTLIESIYVSIRQSCLVLITFGLLCICCHTCDQPMPTEHPETNESQYFLPDTVIIQSRCLFLPSSQQESSHVINEDSATLTELFTFAWFNPLMKRGYNSLIIDLNDLCSLPFALLPLRSSGVQHHRRLSRALMKNFGRSFFLLGILKILGDGLAFGGPIFLNKLIIYMEESSGSEQKDRDLRRGLLLSSILIGTVAVASFLNTHFTYRINRLGLRSKIYLYTRIYSTATQLNTCQMNTFNMGEIVNFMSTDSDRIVNFFQSFHAFWSLPVQIAIVLYLLYQQIGLTFLIGLVFTIILIPINKCIASKIAKLSQDMMLYKDERIKVVSEIIYGMRTIKMNTYENYFSDRINDIRQKELRALRGRKYLDAFCVYFWATTPVLISVLTFTTYTLLGNQLTPAKVFTSLALFALLISPLNAFPWVINGLVEANVSLKRVQRFMDIEPIDFDAYYENVPIDLFPILDHRSSLDIRINQANFSWNSTDYIESDEISLKNIDLTIVRGSLVLIVGRVGSGKTTLLNGILGELNKINGSINVHNAVENGFAFVSQESWIQQMSFRDNILFGKPYNEQLYKRVIDACALENDIKSLGAAGDFKLVGENGVTLSGGQKARLALARAVYQDKDIYLLDDPLSAVDVHVARHLFSNCINGLLKYKTRLLCTHQIQFMDQADYIILVDNGRIVRTGKPNEVLTSAEGLLLSSNHSSQTSVGTTTHKSMIDIEEQVIQAETALENEAEQRCTGTVKFTVWKRYFVAVGIFLSFSIVLSVFLMQASRNVFDWWLSYWTSHQSSLLNIKNITDQTSKNFLNHSLVSNIDARPMFGFATQTADKDFKRFFIIYVSLAIANSLFTLMRAFTFAYGGIAAARKLHKSLLNSLLKCSISFLDATPSGRILNRFSSDTWSVDDSLPFIMNILLANMFSLLGTLVLSCYGLPKFLIVLVPLAIFYYFIQNYYRWTSREIKRISSVSLSPVYAHFGETISGLSTIRAFRHVTQFVEHNFLLVSNSIRAQFASLIAGLWLSFRLQLIGIVMVAGVSLIGVIEHVYTIEGSNPALVGLSLSYILSVTGLLNGLISSFTETEKEMIGVERVTAYIDDLPKEEEDNEEQFIILNEERQQKGATIEYRHATMKYSVDQKVALDNITFQIQSNEKIGIVGRTGSGKSSLLAVLFRLVNLSDGQILIDNVDTTTMRRHTLRQTLAIIPQDPFLFSGTIRENLDPYQHHTDEEIHSALEKCHLFDLVETLGNDLNSMIVERGRNFSVGQKQLFCLARALLRKAKILCLDEATANIDNETDRLIQTSIRDACSNVTVITIAHRVQTILDSDRVIVMDSGRIIEFDTPTNLLKSPQSTFARLVRQAKVSILS